MRAYLSDQSFLKDLRSPTYGVMGATFTLWYLWDDIDAGSQPSAEKGLTILAVLLAFLAIMRLKRSIHLSIFALLLLAMGLASWVA